jgi:hypothetical protein
MVAKMSKVRIILVNNAVTSIFMASYLLSLNKEGLIKNIVIYENFLDDSNSYEKINKHKKKCMFLLKNITFRELSFNISGPYNRKWFHFNSQFKNLYFEYVLRKKEIFRLEKILFNLNVVEICFGNNFLVNHLFYLYPDAKYKKFEHGISDVISKIEGYHRSTIINFRNHLESKFLFFSCNKVLNISDYHTILQQEMLSVFKKDKKIKILPVKIRDVRSVIEKNPIDYTPRCDNEFIIVIMLPFIESNKKEYCISILKLIEYLNKEIFSKLSNRPYFYIKSRFDIGAESSEAWKEGFIRKKFEQYNYLNVNFISGAENFSMEYFLPIIKPNILIGEYSSGLIYGKKLYKNMKTYSYHKFLNSEILSNENINQDYTEINNFIKNIKNTKFDKITPKILNF